MEILKFLNNNKINTEYINILKNTTTNKKYIIKNVKNDDKIILRERINNKYTLNKKINFIPNIIYTQMYDVNLIKQIKTCTLVTRLNEISNDSINTCMLSDYIIIPLKYAQILSNIKLDIINKKTITDLYLRTKRLFSGKIIIYIEKVGCLFENNKVISIIPKIGDKNKVSKNSYDIFTATFIYCISNNYNISDSVKISILSKFLSDNNKQNLNISEVIRLYEKNS